MLRRPKRTDQATTQPLHRLLPAHAITEEEGGSRRSSPAQGDPAAFSCSRCRCASVARMMCSSTVESLPPLKLNARPRVLRVCAAGQVEVGAAAVAAAAVAAAVPDRAQLTLQLIDDTPRVAARSPIEVQGPGDDGTSFEAARPQAGVLAGLNGSKHVRHGRE